MKNLLVLLIFITFVSSPAYAQFEGNKWVMGGSVALGVNNANGGDAVSTFYNINLVNGYVLNQSTFIGLITSFSNQSSESLSFNASSSFSYDLGILYRKYWTLKDNIYFFSQGTATYSGGSSESSSNGLDFSSSLSGFAADIRPGVSAKITDWLLIDLTLGGLNYSRVKSTDDQNPENQSTNAQFALRLNRPSLGVIYSF